ncbi:hypothetical protein OJAV_G00061840 [Oryzias javanicus]|uniref:Uncharacterized protein n=1 Tax=Oryzias javanicus TaxID=123683 RepID=A0A437D628_ORYJA|nr:hypothetical protein OJAV_G00061840 [Oryzias javanicus]
MKTISMTNFWFLSLHFSHKDLTLSFSSGILSVCDHCSHPFLWIFWSFTLSTKRCLFVQRKVLQTRRVFPERLRQMFLPPLWVLLHCTNKTHLMAEEVSSDQNQLWLHCCL